MQDDGPYRNHDIVAFNGPDMRFTVPWRTSSATPATTFQAAIGFVNFEGWLPSGIAQPGYGLAVDDMVVKWREFTLEEDTTDCATSGSCAVIQLATSNVFEGQGVVQVTVLEPVPDAANDCDLDGTPDGTNDCNGNSTPDVVVKATSEAEVTGEIVFLDQDPDEPNHYSGGIVVSVLSDSPGVLLLSQNGADNPTVTVTYLDNDSDPGPGVEKCPNDVDPTKHGVLVDATTVFLFAGALQACEVIVVDSETSDNGDGDFYPDTEEIVDMTISLINNCGTDLTNCTARLFSSSPAVDCIIDAMIDVGDLADTEDSIDVADAFQWKMADLNRGDVDDIFEANFNITMTCDQFNALATPQSFAVTLDLDLNDLGQTPAVWIESFEDGTLGAFFPENLDAGLAGNNNEEGLINGDGYRCQYNDPDWPNANGYGNPISEDCYPGNNDGVSGPADGDKIHWHVDGIDTDSPDGGRSIDGDYSAYYGIYLTDPAGQFTTPINVIESIATAEPINLGVDTPELSFWHQISLLDWRSLNGPPTDGILENADHGVVQAKLVNAADQDITPWFRLEPFQNTYDTGAQLNYFNCFFDPIDDGSTEDDFFDPTDPNRSLGPSSTCWPFLTWSCMGETKLPFEVDNTCHATTEPAPDSHDDAYGVGTWVESKVNLEELRGQRVKLRYLVSGLKLSPFETWHEAFPDLNPDPRDDGWWLDNIRVTESLASPAVLEVDEKNLQHCASDDSVGCYDEQDCVENGTNGPCLGDAPQCGPTCTTLSAQITTDPDQTGGAFDELLAAPGMPIVLDASSSTGACLDGELQYRFSTDGGATVLRGFSGNPVYADAPQADTDFLVEVRCSADLPDYDCSDPDTSPDAAKTVDVDVDCPSSGNALLGEFETILAQDKTTWFWTTPVAFERLQGGLSGVNSYAGSNSTGAGVAFDDGTLPASGSGRYYLVRELGSFCNEFGSWAAGECVTPDTAAPWYPSPVCDRDQDIP